MKTKLIVASIALIAMFSTASTFAATAIYNYNADGSIKSLAKISKLNVYGTFYDLTFSDTWNGKKVNRNLAQKVQFALASALTPKAAADPNGDVYKFNTLADAGTLNTIYNVKKNKDVPISFDTTTTLTSGCTNVLHGTCDMYIVTDDSYAPRTAVGNQIVTLRVSNARGQWYKDPDERVYEQAVTGYGELSYAQMNFDNIELMKRAITDGYQINGQGFKDANATYRTFMSITASPSAVPVPAAALLFAPALLGFMGLRRKAKHA